MTDRAPSARELAWPNDDGPSTVAAFQLDHQLSDQALAEMLREYRSETGWSAFEIGSRGQLDTDFLNWHRWERLA